MKSIAALLFAFVATSALAQTSPIASATSMKEIGVASIGFKGIQLGASGADLVHAYPWIDCPGGGDDQVCTLTPKNCAPSSSTYERCTRSMTYGGLPFTSVDFRLFDGRVAMIMVKVESRYFDRLRDSMVLAFGNPSKTGTSVTRTAAGAEVPNDSYHWGRTGGQISASRFGDDVGHSSVSIVSSQGVKEAERRRSLEIQAGARDL